LGEVALFEPGPATATVQVVSETATVWSLDRAALYDFVSRHPSSGGALLMGIAQCLSQRIRHANYTIAASHHGPATSIMVSRVEPIRAEVAKDESSGLFGMFKKKQVEEPKVKISTKIKF
jgi:CRP-like cAMP-binding protein